MEAQIPLTGRGGEEVVNSKGLTCGPFALCTVEDAWLVSPTCCRRLSQISEYRFSRSGNMWSVREKAHSFTITLVSCVAKRVGDIMPALQAYHAQQRELQCVAIEIVQEPTSSPDLFMVQNCTEQKALAVSNDKLRALVADHTQYFALIFSITEVPLFALLRSGSNVKDATVHIWQEFVFCQCLRLFSSMSQPQVSLC